ncbi:hypothetical protein GALMADRAFT_138607 [Galerina marginata CBS 339.88]|uniref:Uncharacterized protein n=1 Tax=Galerina marginata (strain CBS 339.88) TaxID=685588 RepID=A0A067T2W4_GALM3|nr:hypothetical protein GALMADRAFT_138607 [Galerina marginata CBS 339.88]
MPIIDTTALSAQSDPMPSSKSLSSALRALSLSTNQDAGVAVNRSADVVELHLPGHEELPFDQIAAFPGQDLKSLDFSQAVIESAAPVHNRVFPSARVVTRSSSPDFIPTTPLAEYRERHADHEAMAVLSSPERLAKLHRGELGNSVPFHSRSVFFSPDIDTQRRNIKRLLGIYCDNRDRNDPRFDTVLEQIKGQDRFVDFENVSHAIDNLGHFTIEQGQILDVVEYIIIGNWQRVNIVTAFLLSTLPCESNLLDVRQGDVWATGTVPRNTNTPLFQGQFTNPEVNPQPAPTQILNSPRLMQNASTSLASVRQTSLFADEQYRRPSATTRNQTQAEAPSSRPQPQPVSSHPSFTLSTAMPSTRSTPLQHPHPIYPPAPLTNAEVVRETSQVTVVDLHQPSTTIGTDMLEPARRSEMPTEQTAQESQSLQQTVTESTPLTTVKQEPTASAPSTSTLAPSASIVAPSSSTSVPSASTPAPSTSTSAPSTSTSAPSTSTPAPSTSTLTPSTSNRSALTKKLERPIGRDFKINGQVVHFVWNVSQGPNKIDRPGKPARSPPVPGDLFFHQVPTFNGNYDGSQVWIYTTDKVWDEISESYFSVTGDPIPHPTYPQYFLSLRDDQSPSYVKQETWRKNQKTQRTIRENNASG